MVFKKFFKILRSALGLKKRRRRRKKKTIRRYLRKRGRIRPAKREKIRRPRSRKPRSKKIKAGRKSRAGKTGKTKSHANTQLIGEITHYYPNVRAAVVKLKRPLAIGDPIHVRGKRTDFRQTVGSMQIDRRPIDKGRPGQDVGLEVFREVCEGDQIYGKLFH